MKQDKVNKHFRMTQKRYLNAASNSALNFMHFSDPDIEDTTITDYFVNEAIEKIISTENIQGFNENEWFLFNKQQLSYYRVNYDSDNWKNIVKVLNSEHYNQIHVLNRAQLVDDALNFAFDGYIDFDVAFGVLAHLEREIGYLHSMGFGCKLFRSIGLFALGQRPSINAPRVC